MFHTGSEISNVAKLLLKDIPYGKKQIYQILIFFCLFVVSAVSKTGYAVSKKQESALYRAFPFCMLLIFVIVFL